MSTTNGVTYIDIRFPDDTKIIAQERSIIFHTLIGNVGGYVGFFLGKNHNKAGCCWHKDDLLLKILIY